MALAGKRPDRLGPGRVVPSRVGPSRGSLAEGPGRGPVRGPGRGPGRGLVGVLAASGLEV